MSLKHKEVFMWTTWHVYVKLFRPQLIKVEKQNIAKTWQRVEVEEYVVQKEWCQIDAEELAKQEICKNFICK